MTFPDIETAKSSILVVDDDRVSRMTLVRRLELDGFHVAEAANGGLALEKLRSHPFDLVLLDVMMPEVDGYTTLQEIKKDDALRNIPVIMISALDEIDSVIKCLGMGAFDYLPKPLDSLLLLGRVRGVIFQKQLQDLQDEYKKHLGSLIVAVNSIENDLFDPQSIETLTTRDDAIGELAKALRRLASSR